MTGARKKRPGSAATQFKAGNHGKPKGTQNKTTRAIKDAILHAFEKVGAEDYLVKVARKHPAVFVGLLAKIVPTELNANVNLKSLPVSVDELV